MLSAGISSNAGLSFRKTQFIKVVKMAYSFGVNNLKFRIKILLNQIKYARLA